MQKVINEVLESSFKYFKAGNKKHRKEKGQFSTPYKVAEFMADLFVTKKKKIYILDPGAGSGILTTAIIQKAIEKNLANEIFVDLFEIDEQLLLILGKNLELLKKYCIEKNIKLEYKIYNCNFLLYYQDMWEKKEHEKYDIVIANPPYKRINNTSLEVVFMKSIVHGQSNLYFLFLAMAINLLKADGELVFLVPRSFFSGKHFQKFRQWMLQRVFIEQIHHFKSRNKTFSGDILQEVVIIKLTKIDTANILITSSEGSDDLEFSKTLQVNKELIISRNEHAHIKLPTSSEEVKLIELFELWDCRLDNFGVKFSTGPVVDFRRKQFISDCNIDEAIPLIWAHNFEDIYIDWPKEMSKFAQYIVQNEYTRSMLLPNKNYILIKRCTSKEAKRRIKVNVLMKAHYEYDMIGIENHINYLNYNGEINTDLFKGLYVLLNSNYYDKYYRIINGNIQVNAYELNNLPFPDLNAIQRIGSSVLKIDDLCSDQCDKIMKEVLFKIPISVSDIKYQSVLKCGNRK